MEHVSIPLTQNVQVTDLISINYRKHPKDFVYVGEKHDFWELIYIDKGHMLVTAGKREHLLEAGELLFHKPNEFHAMHNIDGTSAHSIVSGFICTDPCMQYFEHRFFKLTEKEREYLFEALRSAPKEYQSYPDYNAPTDPQNPNSEFAAKQLIRANLELLLIHLYRRGEQTSILESVRSYNQINHTVKIANQITAYLEAHITEKLTLKGISNDLGYSISQLEKLYMRQTGRKIIDTFIGMKMERARQLLGEGDMNVSQIAACLGYDNVAYFSRLFKTKFDMTPSECARSFRV